MLYQNLILGISKLRVGNTLGQLGPAQTSRTLGYEPCLEANHSEPQMRKCHMSFRYQVIPGYIFVHTYSNRLICCHIWQRMPAARSLDWRASVHATPGWGHAGVINSSKARATLTTTLWRAAPLFSTIAASQ